MVNGEFKRGTQTKVNAEPIKDGSVLLSTDEKQLYIDVGTDRLPIEGANAVTIHNKGNITATKAELGDTQTFQDKLTQYIVTNEGRQPKSFDGLIITFSDLHKNAVTNVLYVFNATRGSWNDVGDATYTYPIDQALTAVGTNGTSAAATYGGNTIKGDVLNTIIAGAQNIVDATGTSDENGGTAQQDFVAGWQNRVTANNSFVTGARNIAKGHNTTLNGQDNEGRQYNGYAMGNKNVITGENAQAFGEALIAGNEQTVVGKQNVPVDDAVFVVGNGQDETYPQGRHTAVYVNRNGEMVFPENDYKGVFQPAPVKRVVSQSYENVTSIHGNGSGRTLDSSQAILSGEKSVALNVNQEAQQTIATTVLVDDNGNDLTVEKSGTVFNLAFWAKCAVDKDVTFTVGSTNDPSSIWGSDRTYDVGTKTVSLKANEWKVVSIPVGTGATQFDYLVHYVTLGATFKGAVENPQTVWVTRVIVDKAVNWLSNSATAMLPYDEYGETAIFAQANYGSANATALGIISIDPANNTGALRPQFYIGVQDGFSDGGFDSLKVTAGKTYHVTMTISGLSTDNKARFWITNNTDTTTDFPYTTGAQKDALKVLEPADIDNGTYDYSFTAARDGYLRIGFSSYPTLEKYFVKNLSIYEDAFTIPPVYIRNNSGKLQDVIPVRYKIDEIQYFDSQVDFLNNTSLIITQSIAGVQGALLPNAGKSAGYVFSENSKTLAEVDALSEISASMDATERGVYLGLSFDTNDEATYDCLDLKSMKVTSLTGGVSISDEQIVIGLGDTDRAIINKDNWNKKLDRLTTSKQVYTTNANGTTMGIPWATAATPNTIPYRDAYGRIEVGTPSGANNAVPKSYVDNQTKTTRQIVETSAGIMQFSGNINPINMQMAEWGGHNVAAFCDPAGITVEYSNDGGTTWIDYGLTDLQKTAFVSLSMKETNDALNINLGKKSTAAEQTTQDCLRITIDSTSAKIGVPFISCLLAYTVLTNSKMSITVVNAEGSTSIIATNATFAGSGSTYIPLKLFLEQKYKLILEFHVSSTSTQLQRLSRLALCSGVRSTVEGNSSLAKTGHIYAMNAKQEALFPATVQTPTLRIDNTEVDEEQLKKLLDIIKNGKEVVQAIEETTLYVGENLVTNTTAVTLGNGWSGNVTDGFTHARGNVEALALNVDTTSGEAYIVEFDASSYAEGVMTVGIGSEPKVDPYNGKSHMIVGFVSDGGYLYITPSTSYTGTLQNISVKKVVASSDEGTKLVQEVDNVNHGNTTSDLSGFWNVAVGGNTTMSSNQNGTRDIAIGNYAMRALKSGQRNIAIGTFAMPDITEGDRNIAIGADTLYGTFNLDKSAAYDNVAIGKKALKNGSLVQKNIAVGTSAMGSSGDTANLNTCVGDQAGYYAMTGNTHVGNCAGYYTKGNNNTSLGNGAGNTTYVTGDKCVCIGANAIVFPPNRSASNIQTINNAIVIGSDAKATKSNQAVVGSDAITETLLKGDLIVRGTDGVYRQIVFNSDGTCSWTEVQTGS